jgi:hypothetical protein
MEVANCGMSLRKENRVLYSRRTVLYSSFHLDITLYILRSRIIPKLYRRVLRTQALPTIQQRTSCVLLCGGILACFALAINFCCQGHDVTYADLCELREMLVTGRAQGKPRPTLLVLQMANFRSRVRLYF